MRLRLLSVVLMATLALAAGPLNARQKPPKPKKGDQKQQQAPPPSPAPEEIPIFRGGVTEVTAPVTVVNEGGEFVVNLNPQDFALYDNDARQQIKVELTEQPISLVILVGNSVQAESLLPQIRKTASLFTDLVLGERGEAALLTFDHRVQVMQDFTHDSDQINKAFKELKSGSSQAALSDAIVRALTLLSHRPEGRRRVIVVIAQDRDYGSENNLTYALREAQIGGVSIYGVKLSATRAALSKEPQPTARMRLPPGADPTLPPGTPPTPTAEMQAHSGADLLTPILMAGKAVKGIFMERPLEAYAKGTGGDDLGGFKERAVEDAVKQIAQELHSQYLITYRPNTLNQAGYHTIKVTVDRSGITVRTRPGYYFAGTGAPSLPSEASRQP